MTGARRDRGAATLWLIALAFATAALLALVVDGATILRSRGSAYAAAQAAARAAANQLSRPELAQDPTVPATDLAAAQRAAAEIVATRGMRLTDFSLAPDGVTVSVEADASMQVASVVGVGSVTVDATATAERRTP